MSPHYVRYLMTLGSGLVSYISFRAIHSVYSGFLPAWNQRFETSIASDITAARRLYTDAFEKSMIFAIVIFILTFILLEYIYRSGRTASYGLSETKATPQPKKLLPLPPQQEPKLDELNTSPYKKGGGADV